MEAEQLHLKALVDCTNVETYISPIEMFQA